MSRTGDDSEAKPLDPIPLDQSVDALDPAARGVANRLRKPVNWAQSDVSFAALSRRRPDLSSGHFGLVIVTGRPLSPGQTLDRHPLPEALGFAVPKRLVKGAVERNALKRVAREAWRAASWPAKHRPVRALIKLRRAEGEWKQMPIRTLKKVWRTELDELLARLDRQGARGARSVSR